MVASALRFEGKLTKWNAERGFGSLVAEHGDQELFVHVSALARDGRTPAVGEALTFEVERDREGRKRAVRVRWAGDMAAAKPALGEGKARTYIHRSPSRSKSSPWLAGLVGLTLVAGLGWYGYGQYNARVEAVRQVTQRVASPVSAEQSSASVPVPAIRCHGRKYCSQMTSCEDAKFVLKNCPSAEMDGDGDGVPCEQQWCTGPFGR